MRKLNLFRSNEGFEEYYIVKIRAIENSLTYGHYLTGHENRRATGEMTIGCFLDGYIPCGTLDGKIQGELDCFVRNRSEIEHKTTTDTNLFKTISCMANGFILDGESFLDHIVRVARYRKEHIEKYSKIDVDFHSVLNYLKQRINDVLLNYQCFNKFINEHCDFREIKNIKSFIEEEFNDYYGTTARDVYDNVKRIWEDV